MCIAFVIFSFCDLLCIIGSSLNFGAYKMTTMMKKKTVRPKVEPVLTRKPLFTAAVRYRDGRNELLHIKNAVDIDDARKVVMDALMDVQLVLLSELKGRRAD